ncbi:tyrosine recombinase XerC [Microbacterium sp. NPDC056052]|uniref:site-specific integrase n=1 Tax=Microbacterium sp. NPDC056052 TaxID=3345695 RepID=UPI0035E30D6F
MTAPAKNPRHDRDGAWPRHGEDRGDERLKQLDTLNLVEFVAGTGVRISEACAIAWADVDLAVGMVSIRANAVHAKGKGVIRQPHCQHSDNARPRCARGNPWGSARARRPEPALSCFPTVLGNLRDPRNTARDWALARTRLKLADHTFNSFRKTVATALDQAGLSPGDIAKYLGHADPALTMCIYMSKTVGGDRASTALDHVLGASGMCGVCAGSTDH